MVRHILFVVIALFVSIRPAHAQGSSAVEGRCPEDSSRSVVLKTTAEASVSAYFIQQPRLNGVASGLRPLERPDSELPKPVRYVLGGTFAAVSAASFAGGVWSAHATIVLFRRDALLSDSFGVLTAMMSAGAFGFSIVSGVWSLRLFRGKVVLRSSPR